MGVIHASVRGASVLAAVASLHQQKGLTCETVRCARNQRAGSKSSAKHHAACHHRPRLGCQICDGRCHNARIRPEFGGEGHHAGCTDLIEHKSAADNAG